MAAHSRSRAWRWYPFNQQKQKQIKVKKNLALGVAAGDVRTQDAAPPAGAARAASSACAAE
jgi:hypothetical protein